MTPAIGFMHSIGEEINFCSAAILSSEMHYEGIARAYSCGRLKKLKAMSLSTVAIYMFWNFREMRPGKFDFA